MSSGLYFDGGFIGGSATIDPLTGIFNLDRVYYDRLVPVNREDGLILSQTYPDGGIVAPDVTQRGQSVVFGCDVIFPVSPSAYDLISFGGGTYGCFVGFSTASGSLAFRVRAGGGAATTGSTTDIAVIDSPIYPTDGLIHTVVAELTPTAPGRVRLWIDGVLLGDEQTTGGTALAGGFWTGTAAGGYLGTTDGPTDESDVNWPADAGNSDLRVYFNQVVTNDG